MKGLKLEIIPVRPASNKKFSESLRNRIRKELALGKSINEIMDIVGVSRGTIYNIKNESPNVK